MIIVLEAETITCMKLLGVKNVSELSPKHVSGRWTATGKPCLADPELD